MRRLLYTLFCSSLLLFACNDGDVINIELDFDKSLALCGDEDSDSYVVYDIKTDPFESLTLLFPTSTSNNLIFEPTTTPYEGSFNINQSSVRFNYRTYDGEPSGLICEEIPDSDVNITNDYEASSGTVTYLSSFEDDDNDGVPTALEDLNGNDDLEDDDTDGDGIPNYRDSDDDGDNVDTIDENPDPNGDESLDDAQNTDGDALPDYLDEDDDGDGIITRYEDENLDGNPKNDLLPDALVARYLDETAVDTFVYDVFNTNTFTRTVTAIFTILNTDLEILNADLIELGEYTDSYSITF